MRKKEARTGIARQGGGRGRADARRGRQRSLAIPGLTAALAVSLALPFTYGMVPREGILLLIALYVGGISGALTSAILLNIPGSPASLAACFDGAPMARQGKQGEALSLGVFSSLLGGLFSAVALVLIAPQLAKVALVFGPWEYFIMRPSSSPNIWRNSEPAVRRE